MICQYTVKIQCGEMTCAVTPGVFCKSCSSTHFGTRPYCNHFGVRLREDDNGWIARCSECLKHFKPVEVKDA